ncbi:protein kinase domain-containing protein [Streptodolium elevatio]
MEALKPGDPGVVGRYRLSARLAQGRLGAVFLGKAKDGGTVAVRLVRPDLASDPKFVARFHRTVAAVREVDGLHLAHVLDADAEAKWLVTEYAPGLPLDAALREHGALPEESVRSLGTALARALVAVHEAKVVHQGLGTGTVTLTQDGPQITDLGLPALLGADAVGVFPAPEQATGGSVSAATDVFALAGLLCQAAGVHPYGKGTSAELAQKVLRTNPDLTGLPEDLAEVLARCLARRPDARPAAAELVELLDGADASGIAWLPEALRDAVTTAAHKPPPKAASKAPAKAPAKAKAKSGAASPPTKAAEADEAHEAPAAGGAAASAGVPQQAAAPAAPTVQVRKREAGKPDAATSPEAVDAAEAAKTTVEAPRRAAVAQAAAASAASADDADTAEGSEAATVEVPKPAGGAAPTVLAARRPSTPAQPTDADTDPDGDTTVEVDRGAAAAGVAARAAAESAVETVLAGQPLDRPRLVKPRTSEPGTPDARPAAASAAPPAAPAVPTQRADAGPRWSPAEAPASAASAAAAPTELAPRPPVAAAFPQAAPVQAAQVPAARAHAQAPEIQAPAAQAPATAQPKRQASNAVWYAVIVLVGLTSVGLAVYRLLDSEWRDLQNPLMGLVLPGVSLVFGLAGIVVLALAVAQRRKTQQST